MIKAGATLTDGRDLLILGLSRRNCEMLLEGKPIRIDVQEDMGREGGPLVLLLAAETEADMAEAMKPLIGDRTEIRGEIPGTH